MSQQCLPVDRRRRRKRKKDGEGSEVHSGFDNIESMSASEYLLRVTEEAKKLPNVFELPRDSNRDSPSREPRHRDVPIDGSAACLSYLLNGKASLTEPPTTKHLPQNPKLWVEKTINNFKKLRTYLEKCKDCGIGGKETSVQTMATALHKSH